MRPTLVTPHDPQIERLHEELDHARRTIVDLMPEPIPEILDSYTQCTSRRDVYLWESKAADQIIQFAKPLPPQGPYGGDRAHCPLCGGSPQTSAYSPDGFSLPLGLHRHLTGWGNTHQCDVTLAAFALARDWAREKFRETELQQRADTDARFATRKATEILYQTGPHSEPELLGGQYQWRPARDLTSLAAAEACLQELGFQITLRERIKTYTQQHPGVIVYVDPREEGRIEFLVYRFPAASSHVPSSPSWPPPPPGQLIPTTASAAPTPCAMPSSTAMISPGVEIVRMLEEAGATTREAHSPSLAHR